MNTLKVTKYYAYMLRCADGTIYSGYTTDPDRRIAMHNSGCGAQKAQTRRKACLDCICQVRCY